LTTEPSEQNKARLAEIKADAKWAHELHFRATLANIPVITNLGTEAIKTAILVNGGTAGALLTFVGKERLIQQPAIVWALQNFAIGLLFGGAAALLAYLTQLLYGTAGASQKLHAEYPYIRSTLGSGIVQGVAIFFHICCMAAAITSFGYAVYSFYNIGITLPELLASPPSGSPR